MSLPSLAGLPATPLTGHSAEQDEILFSVISKLTDQVTALKQKVMELEERQKAFETQLGHGHGPPSPPHEPSSGGDVLWGSGDGGQ